MSIRAAILGASGYTGAELLRLLADHPEIEPVCATADSQAGQPVGALYPHLAEYASLEMRHLDDAGTLDAIADCELVFCCLPHGEAMRILPTLGNDVIVDLGGDFRLDDPAVYAEYYGLEHTAPDELGQWAYGLPEFFRDEIRDADRIASAGCYPTATALAIGPLLAAGLTTGPVVVDAHSGTSGAGRAAKPNLHFAHVFEDIRAYGVGNHRHRPEMEQSLSQYADRDVVVSFTAHLVPMVRGIHATVSAQLADDVSPDEPLAALVEAYEDEEFVLVCSAPPGTKEVRGSNMCAVSAAVDRRANRVIVTSVIDNLVKGASGQAIQNANLALGLDEGVGLPTEGLYP